MEEFHEYVPKEFFFIFDEPSMLHGGNFSHRWIAPIDRQCIFSYAVLGNPELEPHAPNTYQSKQVPGDDINSNKCKGLPGASSGRQQCNFSGGKTFMPLFGVNSFLPNCNRNHEGGRMETKNKNKGGHDKKNWRGLAKFFSFHPALKISNLKWNSPKMWGGPKLFEYRES